jgi:CheY-like chemotaxis protein
MNEENQGRHIIVMDDEPVIRSLVAKALSRAGFEVADARDGAEALEKLEEKKQAGVPENQCLMILDLIVPTGMGGRETLLALRKDSPGVKTVIASGLADDESLTSLHEPGRTEVLTKPYDLRGLIQMVMELMEAGEGP